MGGFWERKGQSRRSGSCLTGLPPLPGHTHKQLLVTIPSHSQTERSLQLHKSSTWSQEDAFRRYGGEGDLLTPNLEGGGQEKRQTDPRVRKTPQQTPTSTRESNPKHLFNWSALEPGPGRALWLQELAMTRPRPPTGQAKAKAHGRSRAKQKTGSPACACPSAG